MRFRALVVLFALCSLATAQRPSIADGVPGHRSALEITWHILKRVEHENAGNAELITAVRHNLAVKTFVLKNNSPSEVRFEQQEFGHPPYGCDPGPIDFVTLAKARGAVGFCCATPAEAGSALTSLSHLPGQSWWRPDSDELPVD
jgi:hypothetical protein